MNVPFFIAYRYFRQGGKKSPIHRIGLVSFFSVALSTLALLLVLSVFNGLEGFIKSLFCSFDPDLKITLREGKFFQRDEHLISKMATLKGVAKVVEVIEDNALLRYQGRQVVVKLKGVSENFLQQSRLKPFIIQGNLKLRSNKEARAMLGAGVQYALSVPIQSPLHTIQVFYPRSLLRGGASLPNQLYRSSHIRPGGTFAVEKHFDESYVIVPLDFATTVMGMQHRRSALEIQVADGFSIQHVQRALRNCVSPAFKVLSSQEQQASLMQAIYIERLFVFATFTFILFIASLNVFFILSMMVLKKRKEIAILYTLGATSWDIRSIFLLEGLLVSLSGTVVGMVAAGVLGWLQQTFGLVALGMQTSLIEAYPIEMHIDDFVYTTIGVVLMTLLAAYSPAHLATKTSPLTER